MKIEDELIRALIDSAATLSVLNSNMLSVSSIWSFECIQMVRVANQFMTVPKFLLIPFQLTPLPGNHYLLLVPSASSHIPPGKRFF